MLGLRLRDLFGPRCTNIEYGGRGAISRCVEGAFEKLNDETTAKCRLIMSVNRRSNVHRAFARFKSRGMFRLVARALCYMLGVDEVSLNYVRQP